MTSRLRLRLARQSMSSRQALETFRRAAFNRRSSILGCGLDQRPLDAPMAVQASLPLHENVRGPGYYH